MIEIKEATIDYTEAIATCQVKMAKETENMILNHEEVKKGIIHLFENPAKGFYLLAMDNKKVAGTMLLQHEWSEWRNQDVLWIHSVYIIPEYRRKGIFSQLYNEVKQRVLKDPNISGMRLYVDKTNKSAIEVYQKIGMTDEHYQLFEWMK